MKNKNKILTLLTVFLSIVMLVACSTAKTTDNTASTPGSNTISASTTTGTIDITNTVTYGKEDSYFDWQSQSHETINLNNGAASLSKSGIYELTGTLKEGSIVVNVNKDTDNGIVYLVLNNAKVSSATSAPIFVKEAKKVVVIVEQGTVNTLYQGGGTITDAENEPSSALFSKSDLTITGSGTLNITSDYNDGISSKDMLKIADGTIEIKAKGDGLVGKDLVAVKASKITITAGKDGIRSTNDTDAGLGNILIADGVITIDSEDDALQAYRTLQINGGSINLTTGGGYAKNTTVHADNKMRRGPAPTAASSANINTESNTESKHGLKAEGNILITQGVVTVSAYNDALNANGDITVNGGTLSLQSGDDGIHSDTNLTINDGAITVQNSYEAMEGKNITVNNGRIGLTSSDDGFNVNDTAGLLTISGGEVSINSGGDGTDSNGSIKMTGGTVYVMGPTANNNAAIDYNGSFEIRGGTIIAAGSSGMAQTPGSNSSQPSILMYYSTTQSAGTVITLKDSSENIVTTFTPAKDYASAAISAPDMKTGETYTLYSGTTKIVTFTLSDNVTYLNESGITQNQSMGPGGGMQGGGMPGGKPGRRQ